MRSMLQKELEYFEELLKKISSKQKVESKAPYASVIFPQENLYKEDKKVALTMMALTHGNEVAGVAVLNRILAAIASGIVSLRFPLGVVLGNPQAAEQGVRFCQTDLNRSFHVAKVKSLEEKRALELTPLLKETQWLLDFHQTIEPTLHPFFIFPFKEESMLFARSIDSKLHIVTHDKGGFSAEGMCTDEFVNAQGGTGISVELGQKGFDPYQIALGVSLGMSALTNVAWSLEDENPFEDYNFVQGKIFTWAHVEPYPQTGEVFLEPGLVNFQNVERGDLLARNSQGPIYAPIKGCLLFPKYVAPGSSYRPTELFRIIKSVNEKALYD